MGAHDTADMLPTAQRPFSPEYYPVSVDYGVPAAGSVAINYFTQENFVFVNGAWGKDSVPSVLEQLTAVENKVYTPDAGVDGYDKVTVNVPQLDTSDATAVAADILSPKTAYVNGAKVTGSLGIQTKTATPSSASQTITPDTGKLLGSVTVNAIPDVYIVPTGSTTITANGTHNISNFAEAVVNVPTKSKVGTVVGTATTVQDVTRYQVEYATLKGIMDTSDELVFKLSDSEYTRPLMACFVSSYDTHFEIINYLSGDTRGTSVPRSVETAIINVVNLPEDFDSSKVSSQISDKIPYSINIQNT